MTTESQRVKQILCRNSSVEKGKNERLFSMKGQKNAWGTAGPNGYERVRLWSVSVRERLGIRRHCRALSPDRVNGEKRGESVVC